MTKAPPDRHAAPRERGEATTGLPNRAPGKRRRVPVRLQMSNTECAAACLAMVLSHYGRNTRTVECRELCDAGRDGLSARSLTRAARSQGFEVRALSVPTPLIGEVLLPAVAHWQGNHFLVVERVTASRVDVVDPAVGRRSFSHREFADGFTGVVLEMRPTAALERRRRAGNSVWRILAQHALHLPELRVLLPQIVVASLLVAATSLAFPLAMQVLVDRVIPLDSTDLAPILGLAVVAIALTVLVVSYLRQALLVFVQARLDEQLMTSFFRHMLSLPLRFFQRRSSGDLLMRLTSNAQIRELLASQATSAVIDGGLATLYLIFLFWQAPAIGAVVAVVGTAHIAFLVATTRYMHTLMRRDLAMQANAQGYLVDVVTGIASVKATGAELRVWQDWSVLFRRHLGAVMLRGRLGAAMMAVGRALQLATPVAVLWLGWILVMRGSLTVGQLLAVAGITVAFLGPLTSLVTMGQQFQMAGAYAERLADVLQNPPEQAEPPATAPAFRGHVQARGVGFAYDQHSRPALQDVSVDIEPGRRVAIVGATGSGKTTLALVLLTLHQPQWGEVRYDGVPVQETNYQLLRRNFGVVLQDTPTLDGTIRDILSWQDPGISDEDIQRAARIACLDGDIAAMPMGYDTRVGERGAALSGGQRQRLAIARAVAHRPTLLVLDEATSHLDSATEAQVARNLRTLECTQIVIAHRLSTVLDADEILVMEAGRIRARGTNDELLGTDDLYRRLMGAQLYTEAAPGGSQPARNGTAPDQATADRGRV